MFYSVIIKYIHGFMKPHIERTSVILGYTRSVNIGQEYFGIKRTHFLGRRTRGLAL